MKVRVDISHAGVMNKVEGLTVIIADRLAKEGAAHTYDQLWASASDIPKLDIFWNEAIADLEILTRKYLEKSTNAEGSEAHLREDDEDYHAVLRMGPYWPMRLEGVLKTKVFKYFIHTIIAGWLSGYQDLKEAQDYAAVVAVDMADISKLLTGKELQDVASERKDAEEESPVAEPQGTMAEERVGDNVCVCIRHDRFDLSGTDFGLTGDSY